MLRAFGLGTNEEILDVFGQEYRLLETIKKDEANDNNTVTDGLIEIYKRLRPGEPPTVESAESLLNSMFFDDRRYDLARVGRNKYNKKLALATRLSGQVVAEDIINPETGEVLAEAGQKINRETAWEIQNAGVNAVDVLVNHQGEDITVRVIGNGFVDIHKQDIPFDISDLEIHELVYKEVLDEILESDATNEEKHDMIKRRMDELLPKHILQADLFATVSYFLGLDYDIGLTDDIDHLGNISASPTTSTIWATAVFAPWVSSSKTSSASA